MRVGLGINTSKIWQIVVLLFRHDPFQFLKIWSRIKAMLKSPSGARNATSQPWSFFELNESKCTSGPGCRLSWILDSKYEKWCFEFMRSHVMLWLISYNSHAVSHDSAHELLSSTYMILTTRMKLQELNLSSYGTVV